MSTITARLAPAGYRDTSWKRSKTPGSVNVEKEKRSETMSRLD
jgi:hypothetical protein